MDEFRQRWDEVFPRRPAPSQRDSVEQAIDDSDTDPETDPED
jgi:hypothetical protein